MTEQAYHIPALLPQTLEALALKPGGIYVDVTYGGGGHSRAIVEHLAPEGHLYGFDQDAEAVERAFRATTEWSMSTEYWPISGCRSTTSTTLQEASRSAGMALSTCA